MEVNQHTLWKFFEVGINTEKKKKNQLSSNIKGVSRTKQKKKKSQMK